MADFKNWLCQNRCVFGAWLCTSAVCVWLQALRECWPLNCAHGAAPGVLRS